ncbi:hypothetical protein AC478_00275 [miscellaneous Crenarchaeota group-1 archaeon SG8-32-3]|uniref:Uncharacterized protein n=1 Tax=miscellaneous Crenarchaeota group-1 archaeon SG8-32-3 TaxID=1685125 RepID=A0A0M0BW71_9ARCH|nr:MAG: hypothetical protein AC478_00275 [miscellaneous Crenarchaeota group-1 archaeon SG8-32-3]
MTKIAAMTILLIFLCLTVASIMIVNAETSVVGVSQGDIFEYDIVAEWNSAFTDETPAELIELNQTEWIRITVTEVSGTVITTDVTTHYRNGTETNSDSACDIDTGDLSGEGPPFIGANLGRNDLVNPVASEPWYINETVTRNYKDGPRETNHLRLEDTEVSETVGEFTQIFDYYFDKSTGALVEYTSDFFYSGLRSVTRSKLISSNVWLADGDSGLQPTDSPNDTLNDPTTIVYVLVAVAAIILAIVAAVIILRRKSK